MKTIYFFILAILLSAAISAQNIPIDFEENGNGAEWSWRTFENDTDPELEIVSNPDMTGINTSSTVAKFTALRSGQPFAGCESLHGADIGDFVIDASTSTLRIMVWKSVRSDVGIKLVRADNWSLGEIKVRNTKVNEWEELEFDFSGHLGNPYDQIVIFPDFDNRQEDNVIYFDNIRGEETMSRVELKASTLLSVFPNPTNGSFTINADVPINTIRVVDAMGKIIFSSQQKRKEQLINLPEGNKGFHLIEIEIDGRTEVKKLVLF